MDIFIKAAIDEARKGLGEGGIPIGSVLVRKGKIIGRGHNKRVQDNDPVLHAEIDCLRNAGRVGAYKDRSFTPHSCHVTFALALLFSSASGR